MYHSIVNENHIINHVCFSFSFGCQEIQNQTYLIVINYIEPYGRIFVQMFSLILPFYFNLCISQSSFFKACFKNSILLYLLFVRHLSDLYKIKVYVYKNYIHTLLYMIAIRLEF